jgi:hypothetical protein
MISRQLLISCSALALACVPDESPGPKPGEPGAAASQASPEKAAREPRPLRALPDRPRATQGQPMKVRETVGPAGPIGPLASVSGTQPAGSAPAGERAQPSPVSSAAPGAGSNDVLKAPFHDYFERSELGPDWNATSPTAWRIEGGRLCGRGAKNHPVWLVRRLPTNARVEFDATSTSADGDLKAELWGDGKSAATGNSYSNATSYLTIFGGWKNQFHVLARIDEHAKDRPEVKIDKSGSDPRARPVAAHQTYRFKVERNDGKTVRWLVDDIEIHSYVDPKPLKGPGHEHLGFNDWEVPVCFDNLSITPLEGS